MGRQHVPFVRRNATKGAAIGAGTGIGYYMDQQEMKLLQRLEASGVGVTRIDDNITLNMPGNITFAVDSVDISPKHVPDGKRSTKSFISYANK